MSTGLECAFITTPEHKTYYILQNYNCPEGAWDWMDYATAYGPFGSQEKAESHLFENHANPGAFFKMDYVPGTSKTIDRLIKEAKTGSSWSRRW